MNFLLVLGSEEINKTVGEAVSYPFFGVFSRESKLDRLELYLEVLSLEHNVFKNFFVENNFYEAAVFTEEDYRESSLKNTCSQSSKNYIKCLEDFFENNSNKLLKLSLIFYLGILEEYFLNKFYESSKDEIDYFKINKYMMSVSRVKEASKRIINSLSGDDHTFFLPEKKKEVGESRKVILDFLELKLSSLKTF